VEGGANLGVFPPESLLVGDFSAARDVIGGSSQAKQLPAFESLVAEIGRLDRAEDSVEAIDADGAAADVDDPDSSARSAAATAWARRAGRRGVG
jgi:hypothetical protein